MSDERCNLCGMPTPLHHVGCGVGAPESKATAVADMPRGWKQIGDGFVHHPSGFHIDMTLIRRLLSRAGLALVPAADVRQLPRWEPSETEPNEGEDGPVFDGFLTDPDGTWVRWEDIERLLGAAKEAKGG